MKYFVDEQGRYLGGWDQGGPDSGIEVPSPPADARMVWGGAVWGMPPQVLQAEINAEARAYLASTDWYVVRSQETGEAIPADILAARAAARARVVE